MSSTACSRGSSLGGVHEPFSVCLYDLTLWRWAHSSTLYGNYYGCWPFMYLYIRLLLPLAYTAATFLLTRQPLRWLQDPLCSSQTSPCHFLSKAHCLGPLAPTHPAASWCVLPRLLAMLRLAGSLKSLLSATSQRHLLQPLASRSLRLHLSRLSSSAAGWAVLQ